MAFLKCSIALLTATVLVADVTAARCNADNCYRALFPCPSPSHVSNARSFCQTITAGGTTATNYPTRATSACGTTPDRYISACMCGPTCSGFVSSTTSTTSTASSCSATPSTAVANGDFECGLTPWTVYAPDTAASFAIASPGNTGNKAFEVTFVAPAMSPEMGSSLRLSSGAVSVSFGVTYLIKYSTYFDNPDAGFIGLMINGRPYKTTDARDLGWLAFHDNDYAWTPNAGETTALILFDFIFGPVSSIDKIDSVSITALASCDDAPWPGILPNGGFDCGIGSWTVATIGDGISYAVTPNYRYSGAYCLELALSLPPASSPGEEFVARVFTKTLPITPGASYELVFFVFVEPEIRGSIAVEFNGERFEIAAIDGQGPVDQYRQFSLPWVAAPGITDVVVEIQFAYFTIGTYRLDLVTLQPL